MQSHQARISRQRQIPEATAIRQSWLKELQIGDLVHVCNGSYHDLYPIAFVVRIDSATVYTRWMDDFTWQSSLSAMKKNLNSHHDMEMGWSNETGAGICKWRSHNFILPIEANSVSRWVQEDKRSTIPERYSLPNLKDFDSLRFWLKQQRH